MPLLHKLINFHKSETHRLLLPHTSHKSDKSRLIVVKVTSARFHSWIKPLLHSQLLVQFGQHRWAPTAQPAVLLQIKLQLKGWNWIHSWTPLGPEKSKSPSPAHRKIHSENQAQLKRNSYKHSRKKKRETTKLSQTHKKVKRKKKNKHSHCLDWLIIYITYIIHL